MKLLKFSFIALLSFLSVCIASAQMQKISLNSTEIVWHVSPLSDFSLNEVLSSELDVADWVPAVVPGTVFGSYVEAGLKKIRISEIIFIGLIKQNMTEIFGTEHPLIRRIWMKMNCCG